MENTTIANVKVWKNTTKTETRIYVRAMDGREGCYYLTGNRFQTAKSCDGNLTEADWQEARKISVYDNKWHTVYESELHGTIFGKKVEYSNKPTRCPDCGGYDCGSNCNI